MARKKMQRFFYDRSLALKAGKRRHTTVIKLGAKGQYYVGAPTKKTMQGFREVASYLGINQPKVIADFGRK